MAHGHHLDRGHRLVRNPGGFLFQALQDRLTLAIMPEADRRKGHDGIEREEWKLSRGLALIGELNASGLSNVVQLAKRTGLNRTTCYRLLDTLREDGYVTFDETNALFGLTPQVRSLSEGVSSRDLSSQAALPAMFSLLDQVSWPSDFGVFELGSVLIRESTHPFSPFSVHRSMVGRRRSLVRSALGRSEEHT